MSLSDELDRLAALHRAGVLSDEEFATAKREVLVSDSANRESDGPGSPGRVTLTEMADGLAEALNAAGISRLAGDEEVLAEEPVFSHLDWGAADRYGGPSRALGLRAADGTRLVVRYD